MNTLSLTALAVAQSQIGVSEKPPGSNKGPEVNAYLKAVGLGPGFSWCAAFLYWCFAKAATQKETKNPLIKTAGVMDHWNRAAPAVKISATQVRSGKATVRPGMIGILLLDPHTGAGHTFIVESEQDGWLTTIEGNSNNGGSREGIGVFRLKRRKLSDKILVGFLDYQ
ncbi:CHAP domain-containing protein [Fibrella sp. ES10-3-2-2]|nr:hypothetical protein A6C57_23510 [Fibrella sp. ES10-3-2-2]